MIDAEDDVLRALRNDGASGELGNGRGDDEKSENKLGRTWVDEQKQRMRCRGLARGPENVTSPAGATPRSLLVLSL